MEAHLFYKTKSDSLHLFAVQIHFVQHNVCFMPNMGFKFTHT